MQVLREKKEKTLTFYHLSKPISLTYEGESGEMHYKGCVKSVLRFVWVDCVMQFPDGPLVKLERRRRGSASVRREGDGRNLEPFSWGITPRQLGSRVSRFLTYGRWFALFFTALDNMPRKEVFLFWIYDAQMFKLRDKHVEKRDPKRWTNSTSPQSAPLLAFPEKMQGVKETRATQKLVNAVSYVHMTQTSERHLGP